MRDLDSERRRQKALERLGTNNPRCVHCGETDWRCLELHHPGGKAFTEVTIIECRNCHRKLEDDRKDHPRQSGNPPDLIECVGHFLLGLADVFALLIEALRRYGRDLIERANVAATNDAGRRR